MTGALIILAVTVIAGILLYAWHRMTTKPGIDDVVTPTPRSRLSNSATCSTPSSATTLPAGHAAFSYAASRCPRPYTTN